MTSQEYWAKREAEQLRHNITEEAEYDKRLKQIYSDMLDACQNEINAFYGRYAAKEGITLAEAKKKVAKLDIAAYERKAKRYVADKDFSAKANEEMRLYNAVMKINRLEMLKANIGLELIAGHDELEKFMGGILKGRTEDELKRQAGILGKTVKNNAVKAHAIINGSFHSGTFSDRIWQYQDLMREDLGKVLTDGLIRGKNPRAIAKDMHKVFYGGDPKKVGGYRYCIERLMRTELARVQTEAQKQSFVRNGFEQYTFIVNGGCCDICEGLKGKHFPVAKMMPGENAPPMHPHCRCSTAAYSDRKEYEEWLDHLAKGGTTEEFEKQKAAKVNNSLTNKAAKDDKIGSNDKSIFDSIIANQAGITKSYQDSLSDRYTQGMEASKKAFNKYIPSDSVADSAYGGNPCFKPSEKKVYMDFANDATNKRGAGTTFFHEHGHYIDFVARPTGASRLSLATSTFGDLLKSDYKAYIDSVKSAKGYKNIGDAYFAVSLELMSDKRHSISDLYSALSAGKCSGRYAHRASYWQDAGMLEREAFAHMFESTFDSEKVQYMQQYFPNAFEEFKKLIKGVI